MRISEERMKKIQEEVDKWGSSFDESGEISEFQRQRFRNNINNYYNAMYQNPDAEKMRFEVLRRLSSHNDIFKRKQKEDNAAVMTGPSPTINSLHKIEETYQAAKGFTNQFSGGSQPMDYSMSKMNIHPKSDGSLGLPDQKDNEDRNHVLNFQKCQQKFLDPNGNKNDPNNFVEMNCYGPTLEDTYRRMLEEKKYGCSPIQNYGLRRIDNDDNLVGHYTPRLNGKFCVDQDNTWSLDGQLGAFPDKYNFDSKYGNEKRRFDREAITRLVNSIPHIHPSPFFINFTDPFNINMKGKGKKK